MGSRADSVDGGEIHDRATPTFFHRRDFGLKREKYSAQIHRHGAAKFGERVDVELDERIEYSGIIHRNMERAESIFVFLQSFAQTISIGDIRVAELRATTVLNDRAGGAQRAGVFVEDRHRSAAGRQFDRDGASDTGGGAGDQRTFSVELAHAAVEIITNYSAPSRFSRVSMQVWSSCATLQTSSWSNVLPSPIKLSTPAGSRGLSICTLNQWSRSGIFISALSA